MARQASILTHARVLELFDYDTGTGNLTWRQSTSNRIRVGELAGSVASNGRRYIHVDGEAQMAHRLVWFWHKGEWPEHNLAPADLDHLNTRIGNLIEQTPRETAKKGGLRSTNKTGIKGVSWDSERQEYTVWAYVDGKSIFHSRHKALEDAAVAANEAERGIIPTGEQRAVHHGRKIARRHLWKGMVKWCGGLHRWESVEQFLSDVGEQPHPGARLFAVDQTKAIGPGNFAWSEIGADHRSVDAIRKAEKRERDWEGYRDGHLKRKFRSSHAVYVAKLIEQKGVCAICAKPETAVDSRTGKIREYHVDHDHSTGAVRGLLCTCCNTALGSFGDNVQVLKSAIQYLNRWNGVEHPDNVIPINSALAFGA